VFASDVGSRQDDSGPRPVGVRRQDQSFEMLDRG